MRCITTAHQAELNAAGKMRERGYIDAVSTTGGSDGGMDVRSRRAVAQVKWRGGVAGRPDLQRLYGARGTDTSKGLLFFSASGYSRQASAYAKQVGVALYVYDPTGAVEAANGVGRALMASSDTSSSRRKASTRSEATDVMIAALLAAGGIAVCALFLLLAI